jgi:putative nucleotidyltransferase with HDIG domain
MERRSFLYLPGCLFAVGAVGFVIELTGGLPSQLAHLYYIPVVLSALVLRPRLSLVVALLAAAAVSPLPDLVHRPLGLGVYYDDPAPWNLSTSGWLVRPVAFIAISVLTSRFVKEIAEKQQVQEHATTLAGMLGRERVDKMSVTATSASRAKELSVLSRIDKMILAGCPERESIQEIARLVAAFTSAKVAGILLPDADRQLMQAVYGHTSQDEATAPLEETLPLGEGVSGWALLHGKTAASPNVFKDSRYDKMADFARRAGYTSAAAAPIVLDGEVLGALSVAHEREQEFSADELATLERLADQAAIAIANARQRESLQRLAHETAIALTDAIESRDPYTGDHCSRLAHYATVTAEVLGLDAKEIETIRLGAALHDVGKIVVSDQILKKPGKLTPDEYAIIKQHCYSGGQICKRVSFLEAAYPIVYHHHERFDGGGYPDGIGGDSIPLGARIVSVVDAYDSMTNDRPYRKAMSHEEAAAILREGAGSQWDPEIVNAFLAALDESSSERPAATPARVGTPD